MYLKFWLLCVACTFSVSKAQFDPIGSVDCGGSVYGSIEANEINIYTFELTDDYSVVQFSTCGSNYDTYLYLYDSEGDEIENCDDCGSCGVQTVLTVDGLSTGSYYIGVGGFSSESGIYVLDVTCSDSTIAPLTTNSGSSNYYSDWECNHIVELPLPLPCIYSGSKGITVECIDDNHVEISYFDSSDCSGDVNYTITWNNTQLGDGAIECSYDDSCDYYSYSIYYDECDDDNDNLRTNGYQVIGECSSYDSYDVSYEDTCSSNGDITTTIYGCADCDSSCQEYEDTVNFYDQFNDTFCVEVEYFFVFLLFLLLTLHECFFCCFWTQRVHQFFVNENEKNSQ